MTLERDLAIGARDGYPLLRLLSSFPIAFFTGTLLTDLMYWQTSDMFWADISAWQLFIAIVGGGLAALAGLITLMVSRRARSHRPIWPIAIGGFAVLAIGFLNNLVHSRDAWTSVVPLGLILSAATVVLIILLVVLASDLRSPVASYGAAE